MSKVKKGNITDLKSTSVAENKDEQPRQMTVEEISQSMAQEYNLIRLRASALSLKDQKMGMLVQAMQSSTLELNDETKLKMKEELTAIAESILNIPV